MFDANPLDLLTFETPYPLEGEHNGARVWAAPSGQVSLHFFAKPPDIGCPLEDEALHAFFLGNLTQGGMGLVEASTATVAGVLGVRMLAKAVMDPETNRGRIYVGSFILPFRDFSFVTKAQFAEQGATGVREALVLNRLMAAGELELEAPEPSTPGPTFIGPAQMPGWLTGEGAPHLARNRAEDPAYDADFPDHPLSLVRRQLAQIQASAALPEQVLRAPPFVFPPQPRSGGGLRGMFQRFKNKSS